MTKDDNKVTIGNKQVQKKDFASELKVVEPAAPIVNVGDTYAYNGGNYRVVALLDDSRVQVKNIVDPFDAPIVPISVLLTKDMFGNA